MIDVGLTRSYPYSMGRYDYKNIEGQKFGRLTAVQYRGKSKWLFQCECGNETVALKNPVENGAVVSCGCFNMENRIAMKTTHGLSKHPSYKSWEAMMARCLNENSKDFHYYGGRGITVCQKWQSIAGFIEDMGVRPSGHSIDRLDPNGNYEPGNCQWSTPLGQGKNKRNARMIEHNGETRHAAEWCRILGIPESTLFNRIKAGKRIDQGRGSS